MRVRERGNRGKWKSESPNLSATHLGTQRRQLSLVLPPRSRQRALARQVQLRHLVKGGLKGEAERKRNTAN
jgi:hypothetical protein